MQKFTRCIVVDSLGKPMAFKEKQFFYCNPMNPKAPQRDRGHVLRSYTIKEANDLIKQHIAFRASMGWDTSQMQIIPFAE